MWITFEKIKYKNIMSVGNAPIEIQLDKSQSTLIIGKNGASKSTMIESLSFVLFGKPFRSIKKGQLVNSINKKQCLVEIWFSAGGKNYYVKRGIKPDVFEIHCEGKLIDQISDVRDYQRKLEQEILHMNFKTFSQVVILSISNFKPFMQLETKDRREVIEDILDIKVFGEMNKVLSNRVKSLREQITTVDNSIDVNKQKLEIQKSYIDTLNQDKDSKKRELESLIDETNSKIAVLEEQISIHTGKIEKLEIEITDESVIRQKRTKLSPMSSQLKLKINSIQETLDFYQTNSICPTCSQEIDDEVKHTHISSNSEKIKNINEGLNKLSIQIEEINVREQEILVIKDEIHSISGKIQTINSQIIAEQQYIRRLNQEIISISKVNDSIEKEKEKLKSIKDATKELLKQKSELSESKQYLDIAATLLKDSGIKTKIIEQYVPVINTLINKYLAVMDTWISFNLDGEFNETIKSRYRDDFTYYSFSEGEKQRIDLAILFTWRTIAKMKNSVSCNLLIMDEVADKALDAEGVDYLVKLLHTLGEGTNTFVISHKVDLLFDKFHSVIEFEKVKNFSQIKIN